MKTRIWLLKNLGAINGPHGDRLRAPRSLDRSLRDQSPEPVDRVGPRLRYTELGDIEQAQKHFQMVLVMEAPEDLHGLARNGLHGELRSGAKGQGAEDGCGLLSTGCAEAVPREVAGGDPGDFLRDRMLGWHGLDINDPKKTIVLQMSPKWSSLRLIRFPLHPMILLWTSHIGLLPV